MSERREWREIDENINPDFPAVYKFLYEMERSGVVERYRQEGKEQNFGRNLRITYQWFEGCLPITEIARQNDFTSRRVHQIAVRTFRTLYGMSSYRQQFDFLKSIDIDHFRPEVRKAKKY